MENATIKIRLGNWLFRFAYPLYQFAYFRFKRGQDAHEIKLLREKIKPGMIVYDIGANVGFYSLILSELVGEHGQVHSFEPEAENFSHLKKNVRNKKNINANNAAVSDSGGNITVYKSPELNVDHRTYRPENYTGTMQIAAVSLDEYSSRLSSRPMKVDFVKIDIQGYEMTAFKGMEKLLHANPHAGLLSEFWPYGLNLSGSSCLEYYDRLKSSGRKVWLCEKEGLSPLDREKVETMSSMPKEIYFNIYAAP